MFLWCVIVQNPYPVFSIAKKIIATRCPISSNVSKRQSHCLLRDLMHVTDILSFSCLLKFIRYIFQGALEKCKPQFTPLNHILGHQTTVSTKQTKQNCQLLYKRSPAEQSTDHQACFYQVNQHYFKSIFRKVSLFFLFL